MSTQSRKSPWHKKKIRKNEILGINEAFFLQSFGIEEISTSPNLEVYFKENIYIRLKDNR